MLRCCSLEYSSREPVSTSIEVARPVESCAHICLGRKSDPDRVKEYFITLWVASPATYVGFEETRVDKDNRFDFAVAITDEMAVREHLVLIISAGAWAN